MRRATLLLALSLLPSAPLQAAVEARSPHFRVITALEPAIAEAAARELEEIRAAYRSLGLAEKISGAEPLAVLVFRDVAELEFRTAYQGGRPGFTRGLHQKGADRDFIAIAWGGGQPGAALAHEYAHQLFDPNSWPLWFREGMAEYLSQAERAGRVVSVGGALPRWMAPLLSEPWIPLQELLAAQTGSPWLAHRNFYPQCWLLVHWLISQEPDFRKLDAGAIQQRIDRDRIEALERQLREHLQRAWTARTTIVDVPIEAPVHLRPMEDLETEFWTADMLRELGRREQARRRLETLELTHPGFAGVSESLGAIAMDEGRYGDAEQHFAAAVARGSSNPRTHYRYSLLLMRPVDPLHVERGQRALSHARLARLADPLDPRYILTEAQASMITGEWQASAELLGRLSMLPDWSRQAELEFSELARRKQHELRRQKPPQLAPEGAAALTLAAAPPPIARPPKPGLPARSEGVGGVRAEPSSAWPPSGTILLAGRIGGVECSPEGKIVIVDAPLFRARLLMDDQVRLYYPPLKWRELPCGTRGWVVNAAYRPVPGLESVRGVLVALVF